MEGLGRNFNLYHSDAGDNDEVSMVDAHQATLVIVDATANEVTLQQHDDAAGAGTANLPISHYYRQRNGTWEKVDVSPANHQFTPAAADDLVVVEIHADSLIDGKAYVSAAGTSQDFLWILNDLAVQRDPTNLRRVDA